MQKERGMRKWSRAEIKYLKQFYIKFREKPISLQKLVERFDRPKGSICNKARQLGLAETHRKFTIEAKKKLSKIATGKHLSEKTKKKIGEAFKGKKLSKAHREKIGEALKGRPVSEETRGKIGKANSMVLKGRHLSPKTEFKVGRILSPEIENKRVSNIPRKENHYNWKGGISFRPYPIEFDYQLKASIRKRDNYHCQKCGVSEFEIRERLAVHHIDYDEENSSLLNLISLCSKCNAEVNFDKNYWIGFFRELIKRKLLGGGERKGRRIK